MVIIITDASSTVHKNIIKFMRQYVNIFNLNTHRKIRFTFVNISRCTPGRCNIRHPVLFMIRHESRTLICLCADPWILCKQVRTSSDRRYYWCENISIDGCHFTWGAKAEVDLFGTFYMKLFNTKKLFENI